MANAYSQSATFNPPVSANNLKLDMMVLSNMQQSYDANVAKVDAVIEQYGNIPLKRIKDKEILANNINNSLAEVNKVSKMALTDPNVGRKISQTMKSALTPYILEQSQIAIQIDSFNNQVSKKREKNDGTYSDVNYTDALEQAGLQSYMEGKSDKIGALNYVNYVDTNKELLEPLKAWAKDFGAETFIERTDSNIEGINIVKEGKRLSDSSIKSQLDVLYNSNPNLQKQMQINARQTYKGYSDDEFKKVYEDRVVDIERNVESQKSEIKVLMSNYSKDSEEYKSGEAKLEMLDQGLKNFKSPLTSGNFNRAAIEQYSYKNDFFNSVANTHSYERVENEKYDDTMFNANKKIMELDMKQRELELKQNESLGLDVNGQPIGGTVTLENPAISDTTTKYRQLTTGYDKDFNELSSELTKVYGTEFSSKTTGDKLRFIQAITETTGNLSINNSPLSGDLIEKTIKFNKRQNEVGAYKGQVLNELKPIAVEQYNDLVTGRGNIWTNNLSQTMPNTVKIMASGKKFEQLSESNQKIVLAEIAQSNKNHLAGSDEDKDDWHILYTSNRSALPNVQETPREGSTTLGFKALGTRLSAIGSSLINPIQEGYVALTQGEDAALKLKIQNERDWQASVNRANEYSRAADRGLTSSILPDANISSLQADEIGGTESMISKYNNRMSVAKSKLNMVRDVITTPTTVSKTVSFNPDVKVDKQGIEVLSSLARSKGVTPVKDGLFNVKLQGDSFLINVETIPPGGKSTDRIITPITIPISQAPESLKSMHDSSATDIDLSALSLSYNVPKTAVEKINTINNFSRAYSNQMPEQVRNSINSGSGFTTKEEFFQKYEGKLKTQESIVLANQLLDATYSSKILPLGNGNSVISLQANGQDTGWTSERFSQGGLKGANAFKVAAMTNALAEDFIKTRLDGTN